MNNGMYISIFDSLPLWLLLLPIFICSVIALAIMIERTIFYRRMNMDYRSLFYDCMSGLDRKDYSAVREKIEDLDGPILIMIRAILDALESMKLNSTLITDHSERAIKKIEKYTGILSTIATISPMFGLLGTVTGMMKSFSGLAKSGQFAHDLLASGIAEALITTALGLMVAIPSWIFYNYMVTNTHNYIREIEFIANSFSQLYKEEEQQHK